tara:strand:- start:91 stop:462 length:372 start_codon:yes stop_codon:yes gene_type:complete
VNTERITVVIALTVLLVTFIQIVQVVVVATHLAKKLSEKVSFAVMVIVCQSATEVVVQTAKVVAVQKTLFVVVVMVVVHQINVVMVSAVVGYLFAVTLDRDLLVLNQVLVVIVNKVIVAKTMV